MAEMNRNRVLGIAASVLLVALPITFIIGRPIHFYRIPTVSMSPTLPVNSHAVIRTTKDVRVGDVVAHRLPSNPKIVLAKRIVAASNDLVEIRDKKLFVNGRAVDEPYVRYEDPMVYPRRPSLPEPYASRDQFGPYRVPADSWFVLGDNRDRSSDSRYWGAVPRDYVIGRLIYVIK